MALIQYIIANKGLSMSPGKLAAQVAHGAVRGVDMTDDAVVNEWLATGETKIVLEARDEQHLRTAQEYIAERGITTYLVIDEGRTEVPPLSATVLATEVVEKEDPNVKMAFDTFVTYGKLEAQAAEKLARREAASGSTRSSDVLYSLSHL